MSSSNAQKPWLSQDGTILEDKEIRKVSKSWDQATWDAYLYHSGTEKPMSSYERTYATFSDLLKNNEHRLRQDPSLDINLSPHLKNLEKDSKILIYLTYWEDSPCTEVSEALGKTCFKTKKLKKETLDKLKHSLKNDLKAMEFYYEKK